MAGDKLSVGFIGAGGMANAHMESIAGLDHAEIVSICDLDATRADEASAKFGGKACTDYREMLSSGHLDAVYVVTPPFVHGEIELAIIERGIPFLVEKPVALDLDTARRVRDAVAAKGLITSVGYQLRYLPGIQQARAYLDGRTIGMIVGNYWSTMIDAGWWPIREKSGGQIVEQATHIVDLMRYLGGEIVEVGARMAHRGDWDSHVDIPDVFTARVGFENGALGQITTTCMLKEWNIGLNIMLDGARLNWQMDTLAAFPATTELPARERFPAGNIDDVFLRAVRSGDPSAIRSDYAEGVRTLAVTLAANTSAETEATVRVEL